MLECEERLIRFKNELIEAQLVRLRVCFLCLPVLCDIKCIAAKEEYKSGSLS